MSPAIAEAADLPRRFMLPPEATGGGEVPLEFVHWSLYSSLALNAAPIPRTAELFNYVIGQPVAGAGAGAVAASKFHTNMMAIRTIPKPKTFTIFGVRVIVPPLIYVASPTLDEDTIDTTAGGVKFKSVDDLNFIYNTMAMRFTMGEKKYIESPLYMMPANCGIGGVSSTSVSTMNAAPVAQRRVAIHTAGVSYSFGQSRKPVIWNGQNFSLELICQWATNPTLSGNRLLFVFLDGILGREIQ